MQNFTCQREYLQALVPKFKTVMSMKYTDQNVDDIPITFPRPDRKMAESNTFLKYDDCVIEV